jgi:hypothetical protein
LLHSCTFENNYSDDNKDETYEEVIVNGITEQKDTAITSNYKEILLTDVIISANFRRGSIVRPSTEIVQKYINDYTPGYFEPKILFGGRGKSLLTAEEAIEDADVFFDVLRYYYGAYLYFGGDEVFLSVRERIIEELSEQDVWTFGRFKLLLITSLSDIVFDNHFYIDGWQMGATSTVLVSDEVFIKEERGFRKKDSSNYVVDIDGHDVEEIFRLAMNENGEFFYLPIITRKGNVDKTYDLTMNYDNGIKETIELNAHKSTPFPPQDSSLEYVENIPVISLRSMGFPDMVIGMYDLQAMEDSIRFLSFAEELHEENIVILDIRSNTGGNPYLSQMWLKLFIGEDIPNNYIGLFTEPTAADMTIEEEIELLALAGVFQYDSDSPFHELAEYFRALNQPKPFSDYHSIKNTIPKSVVSNDKLIILLVDNYTGSAGEGFVDYILSIENTLIIGQNTEGVFQMSGTFFPFFLPHSKLRFDIGDMFRIFDENYFTEGIGIQPDIWVVGDALTAVLAMLSRQ